MQPGFRSLTLGGNWAGALRKIDPAGKLAPKPKNSVKSVVKKIRLFFPKISLQVSEISLSLNGRGTSLTRSSNRLPVDRVGDVSRSEDPA
jgi:hypothetical protein